MQNSIIDDATAWDYYDKLDTATPEERIRLERSLREYSNFQQRETYNSLRGFYTDPKTFEGLKKDPAMREAMSIAPTPDLVPIRALNRNFIAAQIGKLPEEIDDLEHDALMKAIASQRYGKSTLTDQEFFGFVKGDYETDIRREDAVSNLYMQATAQALEDRIAGKETFFAPTFKAWADANRDLIDEEGETQYLTQAFTIYRQALWDIDRLKEPAAKGWDVLTKFTQGEASNQDVMDFAKTIGGMPVEDRNQVYSYIATAAKARQIDLRTVDQIAKNIGESVSRGFDFIPKGNLLSEEKWVRTWIKSIKSGDVHFAKGENFPRLGVNDIEGGGSRPLTDDEKAQWIDKLESALPAYQVAIELRDLAKNGVDPRKYMIKDQSSILASAERGFYGFLESLPIMGATAIPGAGLFFGTMAIADEENYDIRLANPNIDPDVAANIATVSALGQAAIEKLQIETLTGRLPILGRFLTGMKPGIKKWAVVTGLSVLEQNVQEATQDLISDFVPALTAAVREDMPDVDMKKLLGEWAGARGDVFFAVLPLALIGGGVATFRDFKDQGRFALSAKGLELAGFSKDQVIRINGAQDLDEAQAIYQEEFPNRSPENIKSGLQKALQMIDSAQREQSDPASPKLESRTVNGKTEWIVSTVDGREIFRSTNTEAAKMAFDETRALQDHMTQQELVEMIKFFSSGNPDIVFQLSSAPKYVRDAIEAGEISLKQLHDYLKIKNEAAAIGDLRILGETSVQNLREEGRRIIVRLFGGANAKTVVEETVEGRVREALGSGRITREWLHEQIAAWDEAHPDDKLLSTGTEQNLIEAVSTLGKAYFAGKIKDGQLPQPIAHFFRQLSAIFRQFFIRATKLKQSLKDGTLSPEFEAMLEESLGFYSEQRTAQKEAHAISDFTEFNTFSLSPDNKAILQGEPVARTSTKDVPIIGGKIIESAVAWIRANPQPNARTVIGSVRISPDGVQTSFSHTRYPNKLAVLPKLTKILERAAYLGSAPDWKRKDATDHYFAAPVEIDNVKRIVFIRVIAEQGNSAALHVHEIYTLEEIEKAGALTPSQIQPPPRGVQTSATAGAIGPMSDLYRSLVKGGLIVNSNTEKAANKDGQPLASGDYNASELSNDLSFSLAPDAKPYDTIPSPTGHEDWAVFTKWDAEKSKGKVKALPIQVLAGKHFGPHRGFGFRHILSEHEGDFAARGIKNQRQFIHRILLDFDEAYSEGGRVTLVANRPKSVAVVELREEKGGFYSVVTAFPKENPAWKPRGERILSGRKAAFAQSGRAPTPTAQGQTSLKPPLEPLVGKDSWEYLRQLSTPVKDSGGTTFSISGQVDHQKISSILNGTYEATTEDHLAARSFERSIRQSPQLLKEFGGHTPKARPISHLETKECQIGAAIGSVFQKRVGLFDTGDVNGPGGHYSPQLPESVFLNQNNEFPPQLGTGHELWHALTVEDLATARRIESLIAQNVDNGRLDGVLRKFEGAYGDHAVQEVAANIFGTVLVDPRFWQELQTPYATEIANALKALPKNAAYDEANLIKDWLTFVKEVANLLRPKDQPPQQRSLLSDPSSTEGNESGKPESSFSISDDPMHGISSDTNSLAPQTKRSEPIDSNGPEVYKINDITDEILRILPGELAKNAGAFQEAAKALERRGGEETSGTAPQRGTTRTLEEWAKEEGRLIPAEEIDGLPLISNSTSEHEVHYRVKDGRAVKRTWPGFYGQIPAPENGKLGRKNATPSEYLRRMAWQIAVFGSDLRLEGVTVSDKPSLIIGEPAGQPSIVISQGWIEKAGSKPLSLQDIADYLETKGFKEVRGSYFGWHHPPTGIVIIDAKPDNFIFSSVGVLPLDLQIFRLSAKELQAAGLSSTDLE